MAGAGALYCNDLFLLLRGSAGEMLARRTIAVSRFPQANSPRASCSRMSTFMYPSTERWAVRPSRLSRSEGRRGGGGAGEERTARQDHPGETARPASVRPGRGPASLLQQPRSARLRPRPAARGSMARRVPRISVRYNFTASDIGQCASARRTRARIRIRGRRAAARPTE